MLRRSFVAFDYYLSNLDTANPTYSGAGFLEALGSADYLDVAVCIDRVTGTGGFDMFIEHSSDGSNFAAANSQAVVLGGGDVTFAPGSLSTSVPNYGSGRAGYKYPLMAFVRLRFSLGNTGMRAHVYATAQLRDREKDHSGARHGHEEHLRRTPKPNRLQQIAMLIGNADAVIRAPAQNLDSKGAPGRSSGE